VAASAASNRAWAILRRRCRPPALKSQTKGTKFDPTIWDAGNTRAQNSIPVGLFTQRSHP